MADNSTTKNLYRITKIRASTFLSCCMKTNIKEHVYHNLTIMTHLPVRVFKQTHPSTTFIRVMHNPCIYVIPRSYCTKAQQKTSLNVLCASHNIFPHSEPHLSWTFHLGNLLTSADPCVIASRLYIFI